MPNNNNAIISCCGRRPFPGSIQLGHAIPCHSHYVYTGQLSTAITIKLLGGNGRKRGKLWRCIEGMRSWLERKGGRNAESELESLSYAASIGYENSDVKLDESIFS